MWVFSNLEWYLLRVKLWRNLTPRNGEHRGLFITKLLLTQRHRWCVEEQRIFASFINDFVYIITKQWFARFLKTFLPKLSATRTLRLCRSLCLRHLREIVCFHLRVLSLSVWPFFKVLLSKGITPNCWSSKKLAP